VKEYSMTMEDVWVETVHESERRDGRKNDNKGAVREQKASEQNGKKTPQAARKDDRAQERKRAA
jgi:hypothetical protein